MGIISFVLIVSLAISLNDVTGQDQGLYPIHPAHAHAIAQAQAQAAQGQGPAAFAGQAPIQGQGFHHFHPMNPQVQPQPQIQPSSGAVYGTAPMSCENVNLFGNISVNAGVCVNPTGCTKNICAKSICPDSSTCCCLTTAALKIEVCALGLCMTLLETLNG